ncbi:hypothetical protein FQN55_000452 [Onygenales sp. PD_40]|nr:hypothetical protein FQN55_000452 [Onygenales sp. PD_40]KAK2767187.1 hypothetical protein FQN53_006557 [Emmonsiellopsis sp. PD_33]KAK2788194.1 hypothetical protein FQN52_006733 [Onygenales sp. PD_12]KAK2795023.1 hypothetical protein FQN51_000602 [Onygenales sp. PD_10]
MELLSRLLAFPPETTASSSKISDVDYDKDIRTLYSDLKHISVQKLVAGVPGHGSFLELLDPERQTLAYLFVLLSYCQVSQETTKETFPEALQPGGEIWSKSVEFLKVFDPVQVRYAGQEWFSLVEMVAKSAEVASRPLQAVQPLKQAILRLDLSCSTFTSLHTTFVRLCLRSRSYLCALEILNKDICHFPTSADKQFLKRSQTLPCQRHDSSISFITTSSGLPGKINYRSYLEYFLYGAMIYMGLKKWENAIHFLEVVISAPTAATSVSMIMVEAYKKWILLSLLENGTTLSMPKTVTPQLTKTYKSLAKPYDVLAEIFQTGSLARLQAEITAGETVWRNDNNMGLVSQVLIAFRRSSILKLEKTFAALSIPDLASYLAPGDETTDIFVAGLITEGRLRGCLMQPSNLSEPTILRFTPSASNLGHSAEIQFQTYLTSQRNRLETLVRNVNGTDLKLELGREYVENLRKASRRAEADGRDGGPAAGGGFDMDEDMMGDLE